jgi:methyl-accepting chemotaxis protein
MARGLEIKLLNYFLLITIASIMIGVEFFFEMNRAGLHIDICGHTDVAVVSDTLSHLRNKIVIMFGVLTLVVAIVLMMFIRNITWPLQEMVDVAARINEGDLSQTVHVTSEDEIGQLGTAINDLTSNLQEIAVFTSATGLAIHHRIDAIAKQVSQAEIVEELQEIAQELNALRDFVSLFKTSEDSAS